MSFFNGICWIKISKTPILLRNLNDDFLQLSDQLKSLCTMLVTLTDLMRTDFFSQLAELPGLDITSMDSKDLCELLLYGTSDLNVVENRNIIEATISFIERSKRFC